MKLKFKMGILLQRMYPACQPSRSQIQRLDDAQHPKNKLDFLQFI